MKCPYCGNNPVPHLVFWYFESINILLSPIRQWLLKLFGFIKLPQLANLAVKVGSALSIISFQDNIQECKVERAKVLWEEAEKRGIKMRELLLFGKPFDVYSAGYKLKAKRYDLVFSGLPRPKNINRAALDVMDDKAILKKKFLSAGLPVPQGGSVWTFAQAKEIFHKITDSRFKITEGNSKLESETSNLAPVIVKPRAGSRGRHSTTYVSSLDDLKQAYKVAKQLCFWVVVEEQLFGPVYRATLINYELCGVLRGDSPQVTGDGTHSISELVNIKNQELLPRVKDIKLDENAQTFLARQNLNFSSIIPMGVTINLSEKVGLSYGGSSSEDFEICHPDNKELFVKAAKVAGDPIVGFDFIIEDIVKSWKKQKCGFLEANSLPFINLHHHPLLGQPRNVAAKVWDMVDSQIH